MTEEGKSTVWNIVSVGVDEKSGWRASIQCEHLHEMDCEM